MRPLPPFNARPLKRSRTTKSVARGLSREALAMMPLSARITKPKVKPRLGLQKPQLKILGEKAGAC